MFENVVVGVTTDDDATRAVRRATEVVRASGGTLHIVAVSSDQPAHEPPRSGVTEALGGSKTRKVQQVDGLLSRLREVAVDARVPVSTHAVSEDPADAFRRVALQNEADLIVVAARVKGKGRELTAVARSVFDKSPCAVLVV